MEITITEEHLDEAISYREKCRSEKRGYSASNNCVVTLTAKEQGLGDSSAYGFIYKNNISVNKKSAELSRIMELFDKQNYATLRSELPVTIPLEKTSLFSL